MVGKIARFKKVIKFSNQFFPILVSYLLLLLMVLHSILTFLTLLDADLCFFLYLYIGLSFSVPFLLEQHLGSFWLQSIYSSDRMGTNFVWLCQLNNCPCPKCKYKKFSCEYFAWKSKSNHRSKIRRNVCHRIYLHKLYKVPVQVKSFPCWLSKVKWSSGGQRSTRVITFRWRLIVLDTCIAF